MNATRTTLAALAGAALLGAGAISAANPLSNNNQTNTQSWSNSNAISIEQRPGQEPVVIINGHQVSDEDIHITPDGRVVIADGQGGSIDLMAEMANPAMMSIGMPEMNMLQQEMMRAMPAMGMPNAGSMHWGMPAQAMETRPVIGVRLEGVHPSLAAHLGLAPGEGVVLSHVEPGMPAAMGGLKQWDVITSVNGAHILGPRDLSARLSKADIEQDLTLQVIRNGATAWAELTPVLADMPVRQANMGSMPLGGGMGLDNIDASQAQMMEAQIQAMMQALQDQAAQSNGAWGMPHPNMQAVPAPAPAGVTRGRPNDEAI